MPVATLLKRISAYELAEWRAFEEIYGPIGVEGRLDQIGAQLAERITNSLTNQQPRPTQADFMPRWGARPVEGYELEEESSGADSS